MSAAQHAPSGAAARCPHPLLDALLERMGLRNDAGLARALEVSAPSISKVRRGRVAVSADLLLRIHEVGGVPVRELRALLAAAPEH
nr:helix-turn-helix domain-containing protein [uncultured Duganella sp.]